MNKKIFIYGIVFGLAITFFRANAELVSEWRFNQDTQDSKGENHGIIVGETTWGQKS